jgi:hypothetical protein
MMEQRIRNILENLDNLVTDLRELSDDIWLNIDHNDSEAAKQGCEFKVKYNEIYLRFSNDATELRGLIQNFTKGSSTEAAVDQKTQERNIMALDKEVPLTLEDIFTNKRPFGFKLEGVPFINTTSWLQVYEAICKNLSGKNPSLFQEVPDDSEFISNRRNKYFSRNSNELRSGREFVTGIFAETNLSANQIRDSIKRLLNYFSIPHEELKLYLREDRSSKKAEINWADIEL